MKRKCGFTRTETVVVSGVAALLGATLFPLAVRAQNEEREDTLKTCQGNLKQVGLGILQYTQDYDEKYPLASHANGRESRRTAIWP
jgi:type II secretory pathway pseudopilin PulG